MVLIGTAAIACVLAIYASRGSIKETTRRGDIIVQALNKYRADHNRYPASLVELCPHYLVTIPAPDWGLRAWDYKPDPTSTAGFDLGVNETERTADGSSRWLRYFGPQFGWDTGD